MIFCTQCGHPMKEGKKFCNKCGAPMQQRASVPLTPPTPEKEPPQTPAAEAFAAMGETMILQEAAAPNQAPGAETPISKEIPVQKSAAPEKPKRNLFPIIFFPILGVCLTVLLILCAPRISRFVWGIIHTNDASYDDTYLEEISPATTLPAAVPTTQAQATESTLSAEEEMYALAYQHMTEKRYDEARELFASLGGYNDSVSLRQKCDLEIAHNYLRQNDLGAAAKLMFAVGKELYESSEISIVLSDGFCVLVQDNDDYAVDLPGRYIEVELNGIITIAFDSQGNIIEWGKFYSESNGYLVGQDSSFVYDF